MAWSFGLETLTGTKIGPITKAYERRLAIPLNGVPTAGVRLRLDDALANEITSRAGDVRLKVYHDVLVGGFIIQVLRFHGELTLAEEVGQDGKHSLACSFVGPLWRLQKRMCLNANTPADPSVVTFSSTDRAQILKALLDRANAVAETGIEGGTYATLYPASAGEWNYKPIAESFAELAASGAYYYQTASGAVALDDFAFGPGVTLHGRAASAGGTWSVINATTGATDTSTTTGFSSSGTAATRTNVSDADASSGRFGILSSGPYAGAYLAQVDVNFPGAYGAIKQGVVMRYTNVTSWIMATLDSLSPVSKLSVSKKTIAGSPTVLATSEAHELTSGSFYTIRLQVNADGKWALWFWPAGGTAPSAPILSGQDDDLNSTGTLQDGKVGIYDANATATALTRYFDSFRADTLTETTMEIQGLDFELMPIEYAAGKIATLNVSAALGMDRPNAVFEYGDGSRSAKAYRRIISREGLVNLGYSLGEGVRTAYDGASMASRGLFEEVISSDVTDSGMRQVLVNEHVKVRKDPREVVTFEPSAVTPAFGSDYVVGDTVRARVKVGGTTRVNGTVRVYGVEVSIDEEGKETVVPTLVQE